MDASEYGTLNGKQITDEMIAELSAVCERGFFVDEVTVFSTNYGKALQALQALDIPISEIEAIERRAKFEQKPLSSYVRTALLNALTA